MFHSNERKTFFDLTVICTEWNRSVKMREQNENEYLTLYIMSCDVFQTSPSHLNFAWQPMSFNWCLQQVCFQKHWFRFALYYCYFSTYNIIWNAKSLYHIFSQKWGRNDIVFSWWILGIQMQYMSHQEFYGIWCNETFQQYVEGEWREAGGAYLSCDHIWKQFVTVIIYVVM